LESLLNLEHLHPSLPNTSGTGHWVDGDPFTNMGAEYWYWSSTTAPGHDYAAMSVYFGVGTVGNRDKDGILSHVWCVR